MVDQTPQKWAESFATDLVLDGERVPFDRVVHRHRQAVAAQRAKGLTWKNLANLLKRAGATREDGKSYTSDHLRVAFGRTERNAPAHSNDQGAQPPAAQGSVGQRKASGIPLRQFGTAPSAPPRFQPHEPAGPADKDISDNELSLAMDRMNKLPR